MTEKINESMMLARLQAGNELLHPLVVRRYTPLKHEAWGADARIEVGLPGATESYSFVVESKSRATLQFVQTAIARAKVAAGDNELPMIQVPFLSAKSLEELE